eukprot:TRINITY_DN371_c0_g1_i1.p1 TRINITY_DN371_c0_g1~~TRINITY_DN371_c0_g1_i1.p1  ORF type:complete len:225 (+),score=22.20 TRINITY_DN371_c0_g1_i1:81-755(+)
MRVLHTLVILLLITLVVSKTSLEARRALIDLYKDTSGSNWETKDNWTQGDPCENRWFGVTCNDLKTEIVGLNLTNNQLFGVFPSSIGVLQYLTTLDLSRNSLSGKISREISGLRSLKILNLSWNQFVGSISSDINKLQSLETLLLDHNRFSCFDHGFNTNAKKCDVAANFFQCYSSTCDWKLLRSKITGPCALPCSTEFLKRGFTVVNEHYHERGPLPPMATRI